MIPLPAGFEPFLFESVHPPTLYRLVHRFEQKPFASFAPLRFNLFLFENDVSHEPGPLAKKRPV